MIEVLEEGSRTLPLDYQIVDVDQDEKLQNRYGEVVPVLLREGVPVAKVRLNLSQLKRLVNRSRA